MVQEIGDYAFIVKWRNVVQQYKLIIQETGNDIINKGVFQQEVNIVSFNLLKSK